MKTEKKFKVLSLEPYRKQLATMRLQPFRDAQSIHHYATNDGPTIQKIVEEEGKVRITELLDHGGTFEFTKREAIESLEDGLAWLKAQGTSDIKKIIMHSTEYEYRGGEIALININNGALLSVILHYDTPKQDEIARELGLEKAERITAPYHRVLN